MSQKTKAKDIMSTELIVAPHTISVEDAIKILVNNRITGFPIVDRENKLIGVISEIDIIKSIESSDDSNEIDLAAPIIYTKKVKTIDENAPWSEILKTFLEKKIRRLPVTDKEGRLKGIITRRDVMKAVFYKNKT